MVYVLLIANAFPQFTAIWILRPDWAIFLFLLLTKKFIGKVAQISHLFMGCFEKHHHLQIKTVVVTFWQLFEEFGLLFIPKSGHTDGIGHWTYVTPFLLRRFRRRRFRKERKIVS